MSAKKHVHKYFRTEVNNQKVWACALSDCTHFMPKHLENLMHVGRKSICWDCGEHFVLGPLALNMDQPKCNNCNGLGNAAQIIERDNLRRIIGKAADEVEDGSLYRDIPTITKE
jgi:hypothetical protein